MTLHKGRKMIYEAFENGIFSFSTNNYYSQQPGQPEQSERPERSSKYYQYVSPESNNSDISNSASTNNSLSDLDYL